MKAKAELRRAAQELQPPTPDESASIVQAAVEWLESIEPTTVLVYLSMEGEIPAEAVVARSARHRFATTRTPAEGWLTVHPFDAEREQHRFGYVQPVDGAPTVPLETIGAALVPGLLFDRRGGRLGWGRGYYDQLLARLPAVIPVGVTLDRRVVPALPTETHDVTMEGLITETGRYPIRSD